MEQLFCLARHSLNYHITESVAAGYDYGGVVTNSKRDTEHHHHHHHHHQQQQQQQQQLIMQHSNKRAGTCTERWACFRACNELILANNLKVVWLPTSDLRIGHLQTLQ